MVDFKLINIFSDSEIDTLRKFVVRVTVPFIIIRNLYTANMETLNQIFPSVTSFITVTIFASFTGLVLSKFFTDNDKERNSYIFSVFVGNYGFLGWGVMSYFYGDPGFTRAVFFSLLFWPVFLSFGFLLAYMRKSCEPKKNKSTNFKKLLLKNDIKVDIGVVVTNNNYQYISDMTSYFSSLGVSSVNYQVMVPYNSKTKNLTLNKKQKHRLRNYIKENNKKHSNFNL